jgi:hypothetical protein
VLEQGRLVLGGLAAELSYAARVTRAGPLPAADSTATAPPGAPGWI